MKLLTSTLAATLLSSSLAYKQTAIYLEKYFDWGNMQADLTQALDAGYNRFYVGFYMSRFGCVSGCADWAALSDTQRSNVKSLLASYNAELYLSIGGPGEFWENCIDSGCAATFGPAAGTFAKSMGFDGVELAMKLAGEGTTPSSYSLDGGFIAVAQEMATTVRSAGGYSSAQVAISSNAPYFSPAFNAGNQDLTISTLALNVNQNQTWAVTDVNLMMFNEDNNYMTYNDIFLQNNYVDPIYGIFGKGSAVQEIMNLGINGENVAIIKPISDSEQTVRTGYVPSSTLGSWGCTAQTGFSWTGGFVGWTWNSANSAELNKVLGFSNDINADC